MIKISDTHTFQLGKLHSLCFVGKEAFLLPCKIGFMPTKLAWYAKKRGFRKVITRKGPTFVHETHKLVPKSTLSTLHCQKLFGGEERTHALAHICASSRAALSRWQFPEAFISPFFFPCAWQHRLYLIFLYCHQWQPHITLECVFTVCSGMEGQSDMMCLSTWSISVIIFIEKLNIFAILSS